MRFFFQISIYKLVYFLKIRYKKILKIFFGYLILLYFEIFNICQKYIFLFLIFKPNFFVICQIL